MASAPRPLRPSRPSAVGPRARRGAGLAALLALLGGAPVAAQPVDPPGPGPVFREAYRAHLDGRYHDAATDFDALVRRYPSAATAADAAFYEGQALLGLGQAEAAARAFAAFERANPSHPFAGQARLGIGRTYFDRGDFAEARRRFDALAAERPGTETAATAYLWAAESSLRMGDDAGALGRYRRAADAAPDAPTAPAALYALAFHQVRLGQQRAAAETLAALEARYPGAPFTRDVGLAYAEVYYALGDWARLVETVEPRLESLDGDAATRATFLLADAYLRLNRPADAERTYRRALARDAAGPYARPALYGLGTAQAAANRPREAAATFALAADSSRDSLAARATYARALALRAANDPDGATSAFAAVAEGYPGTPLARRALYERAVLLYGRERWRDAADAFDRYLAADPNGEAAGEAFELAANARLALGETEAAERLFERAIQRGGTAEGRDALGFQRAALLYRAGAYDRARAAFVRLAGNANDADVRADAAFWAAEAAFQTGEFERAEAESRAYIEANPRGRLVPAARYLRAWAFFKLERYDEAATAFERFIDTTPNSAETRRYRDEAHLRLGDAYFARRRHAEAANAYARAAGDARDYGLYGTGQAYAAAGQTDRAERAFTTLLRDYPDSDWRAEARYGLGFLRFQNGRYADAIAQYERLLADYPDDPLAAKAQYGIGDAHYNADRPQAAADAYAAVLERYPASPFAADAAASLGNVAGDLGDADRYKSLVERFSQSADPVVAEELRFRQAEALYTRGDADAARTAFDAFLQNARNPALRTEAAYYLGALAADAGETGRAADLLRRVLTGPDHPRKADAARRLGGLLLTSGDAQGALDAFRTLEALAAGDPRAEAEARVGQARALLALNQPAEAAARVEALAARDPAAALVVGRAREAAGDADAALAAYRTAAAEDGETGAEATVRLGTLLLARNDARGALTATAQAETKFEGYDEWIAGALLVRGRAHVALRRPADARRAFEAVEAAYPDTEWARTAARERAALDGG